jgi:hypothetical protein
VSATARTIGRAQDRIRLEMSVLRNRADREEIDPTEGAVLRIKADALQWALEAIEEELS